MAVRPIDAERLSNDLKAYRQQYFGYGWCNEYAVLGQCLSLIDAQPTLTPPNETPPCYQPDGDGCAYQCYDGQDEPIEKCKACPLCYSDKQRHYTPPNEPLTLDELLKMDGEPVYVVFRPDISGERSQSWALVNVDEKYGEVYLVDSIPGASCYYDEIWADLEGIYRRPPEGEEDT